MKRKVSAIGCGVFAMVWCAAVAGVCAVPNVPETWTATNSAGWLQHDLVNERLQNVLVAEDGALKLSFKAQTMDMPPEEYVIEAGSGASSGTFTGDYIAQGVTDIRFRLFCQRQAKVSLILWNKDTGRLWRHRIPNIRTGEWMCLSVPVSIPALQCLSEAGTWALFETDLRNVTAVGVAVQRERSMAAQVYRLDDFTLAGPGQSYATWMEQFPRPQNHGTGNCNILPEADLDGDGVPNDDEYVAGTSAGDSGEFFKLAVERGGNRARLRWTASPGRRYQVWSTSNLGEPFVPATPPTEVAGSDAVFDDTSTNGVGSARFYRVTVERTIP